MNTVVRTVGSVIGSQVAVTLLASDTIGRTSIPAKSLHRHRCGSAPARP